MRVSEGERTTVRKIETAVGKIDTMISSREERAKLYNVPILYFILCYLINKLEVEKKHLVYQTSIVEIRR